MFRVSFIAMAWLALVSSTSYAQQNGNINPNSIQIISATYGGNISRRFEGNATRDLSHFCEGKTSCNYNISTQYLGDPAYGMGKDFTVEYACGGVMFSEYVGAEANGSNIRLACRAPGTQPSNSIYVITATYGGNVSRRLEGNARRDVSQYCDGKFRCAYNINTQYLGDPAYGSAKDFTVEYSCGSQIFREYVRAEANQNTVVLNCAH